MEQRREPPRHRRRADIPADVLCELGFGKAEAIQRARHPATRMIAGQKHASATAGGAALERRRLFRRQKR